VRGAALSSRRIAAPEALRDDDSNSRIRSSPETNRQYFRRTFTFALNAVPLDFRQREQWQ